MGYQIRRESTVASPFWVQRSYSHSNLNDWNSLFLLLLRFRLLHLLQSSMAIDKDSHVSSDRQKWQKIFNALVHMLQTQQTQVESLAKERKLLEDRIKFQYDRWLSDVHSLQDQIAQVLSWFAHYFKH